MAVEDIDKLQGDRKIIEILKSFGASVSFNCGVLTVEKNNLSGIEIDVDNITLYDYAYLKDTPLTVKTVGSYWAFDKEEWEAFKQSDECKNLIKDYKDNISILGISVSSVKK